MPSTPITLDTLRRYAISRSLFAPTTLPKAIEKLGFVQADPIRAPARAQDLTLRHRVKDYAAGDLEQRYAKLGIEEDFFMNYGFLPRSTQALMHPRVARMVWPKAKLAQAEAVLDFVRERGVVHPKEVDAHFAHGRVRNWFGGSSNASTQLLDGMHYRGMLRVAGRASGTRLYCVAEHLPQECADPGQALDALLDVIVHKYAPLPERSLRDLVSLLLRGGVPQWNSLRSDALARAKERLPSMELEGNRWYWPEGESPAAKRYSIEPTDTVHLLAPFDPVVWDRRRFELFWGWAYRFEAYTPAPKRIRGYYALPLLWRGQVIGWGNLSVNDGKLQAELGYVTGQAPKDKAYRQALAQELASMESFLLLNQ
ncbi:crosslink repair DNA glycosylase YcaQ family protein [Variovorax sp. PCZ-1]|uniref:DNA glycosylase AlkZ-like family protein n=1 Tax=Variovorax sp. PCZ-1 TaxID=2835533 RepID=UPI001BCD170B|nr:crosslink repair DNA glycosylase YcaQ family protein [Variovorax sp. PCZ-1]MBS7806795.1 YcaQ family DNA glycosylase [Variovorax sp. PCZ-1]